MTLFFCFNVRNEGLGEEEIGRMKAIVFDMDGVIFDSERAVTECWKTVADRHGVKGIEEACRKCLGTNAAKTREIMKDIYGEEFPYDEWKQESSALYHERYDGGRLPKKEGIEELLIFLRDNGYKIALASSTRRQVVVDQLECAGLLGYFEQVVCGDMVLRSKPDPEIYLKACDSLKADPKETYAVEDSYNGIRSAHSAGMKAIMVPDMAEPTQEMERLSVCILPSLTEVKQYFCRMLREGEIHNT